jgi:hypothetical protein
MSDAQSTADPKIEIPESQIIRRNVVYERGGMEVTEKTDVSGRSPVAYWGRAAGDMPVQDAMGRLAIDAQGKLVITKQEFRFRIHADTIEDAYAQFGAFAKIGYERIMEKLKAQIIAQGQKIETVPESHMPPTPAMPSRGR